MSNTSDTEWDRTWTRRCDVLHKLNVTYRYHRRRQRFFDLVDKYTKAATVLLGASLLGAEVKNQLPLVASAISSLGLTALVFSYGDRKQAHKELSESAMLLVGKIEEAPTGKLSDEMVAQWEAEFSRLNAKEPPALKTLVIICEREQATASGHPTHIPEPAFYKRWVADFVS